MNKPLTTRQMVFSDIQVQDLIKDLLAAPQEIQRARDNEEALKFELQNFRNDAEVQEEIDMLTIEVGYEVTQEVDEKGKAIFSNEKKRADETKKRLNSDPRYSELVHRLHQAKSDKAQLAMKAGRAHNAASFWYANLDALRSVAQVVAGLCSEEKVLPVLQELAKRETMISNIRQYVAGEDNGGSNDREYQENQ
jgi:predicted mannosyl-3-phosphoglycerate phosphatase (HAD superfamily)